MKLELLIKPRPASRPRFGNGRTYNDEKYTAYKEEIQALIYIWKQHQDHHFFSSAIRIDIDFHIPMPKSWTKKEKAEYLSKPHTQKPDIDNLTKAIYDSFLGIFFVDDSIICDGRQRKFWSETGKIVISITEI